MPQKRANQESTGGSRGHHRRSSWNCLNNCRCSLQLWSMLPVKRDKISLIYLLQAALALCHPLGWQPAPQSTVSGPIFSVAAQLLQVLWYRRSRLVQGAGKQCGWLLPMGAPTTFISVVQDWGGLRWFQIFTPKDEMKGNSTELCNASSFPALQGLLSVPKFSHLQRENHQVLRELSYNVQFLKVTNSSCHRGHIMKQLKGDISSFSLTWNLRMVSNNS